MKSDFLTIADQRGYLYQCTNPEGLDKLLKEEQLTAYIGFDCTAASLHVGSLVQIMMLRLLQNTGHKIIVLLGGGTTKIGDPSGKDKSRVMLTSEQIAKNKAGITDVLEKFISFKDDSAIIVDNDLWLRDIKCIEFLRDIGKHFSINRMLDFESIKSRLEREQNLSFLEFNYMLLQAYDFVELHKRYGCRLELGGSDQWGNIVSGIELGRKLNYPDFYGLTSPLITTVDGVKMGKTAGKAIWLSAELFSPYDYWQYFRNVDDRDVGKFLRLFTDLPMTEITRLEQMTGQDINEAKKVLATETTAICHGREQAQQAVAAATAEFEKQDSSLLPVFSLEIDSITVAKLLSEINFSNSNSASKRLIAASSVRINDTVITDPNHLIRKQDGKIKVTVGKKRCCVHLN